MTTPSSREPLPDALRALALLGVLLVNVQGYRDAPTGRLLGTPLPADSVWAQALTFLIGAFVQGKAYPVLALLFGMGLAYAARGRAPKAALAQADRRHRRLLLLGVVHGVFLYFGDILTLYALCGFWVSRQMREPWRRFAPRLRRAVGWAVAAAGVATALAFVSSMPNAPNIAAVRGYAEFLPLNAGTYAAAQLFAVLLALPLVRLPMLAGVAAVRLRLLTHRRWREGSMRFVRRWGAALLAVNLMHGAAHVVVPDERALALQAAGVLWTMPLAAVYLALAATAWRAGRRGWARWLAPLGQHTLTVYVGASVLMLGLFSGAGLGWQAPTAVLVAYAVLLWCAAVVVSTVARGRWPLEAWMARR